MVISVPSVSISLTAAKGLSQVVGLSVFFRQPLRGFCVTFNGLSFRIPIDLLAGSHGNVTQMANRGAAMSDTNVSGRRLARFHAVNEVLT